MKMVITTLVFFAGLHNLACKAQSFKTSLKIGNRVPEVITQHVLNYPSAQLKLSDFKGKLVILDFWGVSCSNCIKEMPEMQAFQEKFKDKIQVLLVTTDLKTQIQHLKKNSAFFAQIKLPIIYADQRLTQLFPWTAYGLHVWIDKDRILRYRTNSGAYSEADIADFLNGNLPSLTPRNDTTKFNRYVPIWQEGGGRQVKHIQYYSYITNALSDYAGGDGALIIDSITEKPIGVKFINSTVLNLYVYAFQEWGKNICDSIVYEIKDSAKYFCPDHGDINRWLLENEVSYELQIPLLKSSQLFSFMRQDLERYFDLRGEIDSISKPCLILSCDSAVNRQLQKQLSNYTDSLNSSSTSLQDFLETIKKFENMDVKVNPSFHYPENMHLPSFSSKEILLSFLNDKRFKLTEQFQTLKLLRIKEKSH